MNPEFVIICEFPLKPPDDLTGKQVLLYVGSYWNIISNPIAVIEVCLPLVVSSFPFVD